MIQFTPFILVLFFYCYNLLYLFISSCYYSFPPCSKSLCRYIFLKYFILPQSYICLSRRLYRGRIFFSISSLCYCVQFYLSRRFFFTGSFYPRDLFYNDGTFFYTVTSYPYVVHCSMSSFDTIQGLRFPKWFILPRLLRSAAFVHFSPYYIFPQWSILPLLIFAFSWPSTKILQIFLQQCKTNFYIISFFLLSKYIMQKFWNSWYCFTSSHGCWPRLSRQRGVQKWSFEIAMPLLHNLWLSTPYRHTTMSSLLTRNCKAHLRSYL